jgi:hypothetical protein
MALRIIVAAFSVAFGATVIFAIVTTAKHLANTRATPPISSVNS